MGAGECHGVLAFSCGELDERLAMTSMVAGDAYCATTSVPLRPPHPIPLPHQELRQRDTLVRRVFCATPDGGEGAWQREAKLLETTQLDF